MDIARKPALKALGKIADGLGKGAWYWPEHIWDEKVHNALIEDVVTSVEVVDDGLTARQKDNLLLW